MVAPVPEAPTTVYPGDTGGATESADATKAGELRNESVVEADRGDEVTSEPGWRAPRAVVGALLQGLGVPGTRFVARCARCGCPGWPWREPAPAFGD